MAITFCGFVCKCLGITQALVSSLEKKIDETEKKYEETNKLSEERLKQALEAESKIIQLKTNMQRCVRQYCLLELLLLS